MAYYDPSEKMEYERKQEAFKKLNEYLSANDMKFELDISDKYYLSKYLKDLDEVINSNKEELTRYRLFFSTLSMFLPRQSSIHDIIG